METVTSLPTICGEDTISIGQEVWVNGLAPMAGRYGPIDCMPGKVLGFLRDGQQWLVTVRQKGTLALPVVGDAWVGHFQVRQISV